MDTVLLFALPLVGGLIFCTRCNLTRWRVAREDGHRLYFRAVLFGSLLFATVAGARIYLESTFPILIRMEGPVVAALMPMVAVKDGAAAANVADLAITCFVSMLVAYPLALLSNLVFWRGPWLRRAIQKNPFEAALLDATKRPFPVMLTMNDGKVYVGYLLEGFNPGEDRKFLSMLPLMSGYRTEGTHKITFTTFYDDVYGGEPLDPAHADESLPGELSHLNPNDFIVWLPVDKMASYRLFDASAYKAFQIRGAPGSGPMIPAWDGRLKRRSPP